VPEKVEAGAKSFHQFPSRQSKSPVPTESALRSQEAERKRISRELHDEFGQGLMTLRFSLEALFDGTSGPLKSTAQEALSILDDTIEGLRRIIRRLSPRPLEDLGLVGAIRREAELIGNQTGMTSTLTLPVNVALINRETQIAVYRCVQEALLNISKHSRARNFAVVLESSAELITLQISDNGAGFRAGDSSPAESFGLAGMRERVEELGGTLRIRSGKGTGTRILIQIPVSSALGKPALDKEDRNFAGKAS
jgi:signal transduction histidine kinase